MATEREGGASTRRAPVLCPQCGMPDVREVVRRELGGYGRWHDRIDLRCIDCDWQSRDPRSGPWEVGA